MLKDNLNMFVIITALLLASSGINAQFIAKQNQVLEWSYHTSKAYPNPFMDVEITALIKDDKGNTIKLPGFWKGKGEWAFRFSSPGSGTYSFLTECSDRKNRDLNGRKGTISVIPYDGENLLFREGALRISGDKRHFEHNSGKPFLWLADSWWFGMSRRISYNDFQLLVDDRKQKGFSVIQFAIGFACDIKPFDDRDKNEAGFIWNEDLNSINPEYFNHTDRRISYLVESGIVPNIVGAWGYYIHFLGTDRMKKHWRYLIARYGAYPVCWTLCGEAALTWYQTDDPVGQLAFQKKEWSVVAEYIKMTDPWHHLLTVHSGPNSGGYMPVDRMDLIDFFMTQPGHNDFETLPQAIRHIQLASARYPDKPFMAGEVCFEGMGGSNKEKIQRYLFWSHMLLGAAGHGYGTDAMWQFNSVSDKFGKSVSGHIWGNEPWEEAYKWPGSLHVGTGRKILLNYRWYDFKPHPEWITPSATSEKFMDPFAAGIEKEMRIFYFPGKVAPWGTRPVIQNIEKDIRYVARWIDPLTGDEYPIGVVNPDSEGKWRIPFAPILHDWVMVMEKI